MAEAKKMKTDCLQTEGFPHSLCGCHEKEADDGVVMRMRHTSGLTNMDYQRYGILCPFDCETLIDRIIDRTLTSTTSGRYSTGTRLAKMRGRLADAADVHQLRQRGARVPGRAAGGDARVFGGFDGTGREEEARVN